MLFRSAPDLVVTKKNTNGLGYAELLLNRGDGTFFPGSAFETGFHPIGIAVAPGDGLLVNFLENTLGALEASGLLEALRIRWLENGDWLETLP